MPSVFTDATGNGYDLAITTSGDWTIHSADLPNGDASASLSTTLNQNAYKATEDFCLPNGSGSEARTLEFWVKVTNSGDRTVLNIRTNGTATTGTNQHLKVYVSSTETIGAIWLNTSAGAYLSAVTSAVSTGWHHVVIIFHCGSSKSIEIYIDGALSTSTSSTSGTPTTASSDAYEFYLGAARTNATEEMTDNMAKVAWYPRALTTGEISDHYLAMTAS